MKSFARSKRSPRFATLLLAAAAVAAQAGPAAATRFLTPVGSIPYGESRVTMADGQVLLGEVSVRFTNYHGISTLVLKQADGSRRKLSARDVQQIVAPLPSVYRLGMIGAATTTIEKAAKTDYEQIATVENVTFDTIAWPKASKRVLLQRVNPGFDRAIQVYAHENSKEGTTTLMGVAAFGDEPKGFIVVKNGGKPFKVTKGDYEDDFERIFADCPELVRSVPEDDRDFDEFAEHVLAYDRLCAEGLPAVSAR